MGVMSELNDLNRQFQGPDPSFDMYRLEAAVTDLRGHHPSELDFDRIIKCARHLNKIASAILDDQESAA